MQSDKRAPKLSQGLPVCDWLCLLPTLRAGRAKTKILKCNKKFQHEGGHFHPHWPGRGPDGQCLLVIGGFEPKSDGKQIYNYFERVFRGWFLWREIKVIVHRYMKLTHSGFGKPPNNSSEDKHLRLLNCA